jgi:hypothetical protein
MTATTQQNENVADTVDSLAAKIGFVVGVDKENCAHIHYPAQDAIKVYPVGSDYEVGDYVDVDPEHAEQLEGRPLAAWMEFVQVRRGWELTTHRSPEGF